MTSGDSVLVRLCNIYKLWFWGGNSNKPGPWKPHKEEYVTVSLQRIEPVESNAKKPHTPMFTGIPAFPACQRLTQLGMDSSNKCHVTSNKCIAIRNRCLTSSNKVRY